MSQNCPKSCQWCLKVASKLSQFFLNFFPTLFKVALKFPKVVLKLSQGCLKIVSKLSQSRLKVVSILFQCCPKVVPSHPKIVYRLSQCCSRRCSSLYYFFQKKAKSPRARLLEISAELIMLMIEIITSKLSAGSDKHPHRASRSPDGQCCLGALLPWTW